MSSSTLPALANSLLKAFETLQHTRVEPPEPVYDPHTHPSYFIGVLKGYEAGYRDGLHAFEPLVPSGFKNPYYAAVKMLFENPDRKGLEKLLNEIRENIPCDDSKVDSHTELK